MSLPIAELLSHFSSGPQSIEQKYSSADGGRLSGGLQTTANVAAEISFEVQLEFPIAGNGSTKPRI